MVFSRGFYKVGGEINDVDVGRSGNEGVEGSNGSNRMENE
ncbi:hypothetical protein Tco_0482934, partial [Tanacetum coccineum]